MEIVQLIARQDTGQPVNRVFPHLLDYCSLTVEDASAMRYDDIDLAFFATPDRAGMDIITPFIERGIPVIDFSGDFRFQTADVYAAYAVNRGVATEHHAAAVLPSSVYGLPERNAEAIRSAAVIGNPGCFAISLELALLPLAAAGLLPGTVICDSKSGVSGAGKNPGAANFLPQRHENINTYREGATSIFSRLNMFSGRHRRDKTPVSCSYPR
jgi:N-acetyl-gamma-glutamyl-phosphate reductase